VRSRASLSLLLVLAIFIGACSNRAETGSPATPTAPTAPSATPPADRPDQLGTYRGVQTTIAPPDFQAIAGARADFGTLGRAGYRIEIPDDWNGDLVLWAHGFRGFGTEVTVTSPPRALREAIITSGAAWAASSYSENGYVPGIGVDDTLALKGFFEEEYGTARRVYIAGQSMGGNVVALALEYYPEEFDGALSFCGTLGGQEQIDFLVSWAAVASFLAGVDIPVGRGQATASVVLMTRIYPALGSAHSPTARGIAFANVMKNLTGGDRPFFNEGFREQFQVNFGLLLADPDLQSITGRAATNEGVRYEIDPGLGISSGELNEGVQRLSSDPEARNRERHPDAVPTTGKIQTPLLALHNTGDLFVPISHLASYRQKVDAAGSGDLFVERSIRAGGHCQFSDQELRAAYEDLVAWVEEDERPEGEDISGDLTDAGRRFTNPLRPGDPGNR
jgi:pimeloyl-ACP methyl ester carboxylesterase